MKNIVVVATLLASASALADEASRCRDYAAVRGCQRRYVKPWRPVLTLAIEGGVSHWNEGSPGKFDNGFGTITTAGGAWGARVGVDFFSWLGLEVRYLGLDNKVHKDFAPDSGYATTAGLFDVRIGAPIPYVHPYAYVGIGVYNVHNYGSPASNAAAMLNSHTQAGIPAGFGLEVPINWHFSLAAEASYHFQIGESFAHGSANVAKGYDGGDVSTFTGVFRVRL
jgi:hypothetical protein